jgi:FKBP-type peptidyl-prolyl cis-trans isomerase FkpA
MNSNSIGFLRTGRAAALVTTFVLPLAMAACSGGKAKAGTGDPATTTFDSSLDVNLAQMTKTASGLYYQDLTVGTGDEAASGSSVTVDYTVWLPDGKKVDSGTFPFTLGAHKVVAGFDEGVTGMKVGGVRKLVVPPALGYGAQGSGPIPGNSVLVFEVTLKSVS